MEHLRKPMRLAGYDYRSAGMYFITLCTEGRRPWLCSLTVGEGSPLPPIRDLTKAGLEVEGILLSIPDKYPSVLVDKYVIMPNHLHIIVVLESPQITPGYRFVGGETPPLRRQSVCHPSRRQTG